MKTEFEKMRSGELYCFEDQEIANSIIHAQDLCAKLQTMTIYSKDYRSVMEELIPGFNKSVVVCPPFSLRPRTWYMYWRRNIHKL